MLQARCGAMTNRLPRLTMAYIETLLAMALRGNWQGNLIFDTFYRLRPVELWRTIFYSISLKAFAPLIRW